MAKEKTTTEKDKQETTKQPTEEATEQLIEETGELRKQPFLARKLSNVTDYMLRFVNDKRKKLTPSWSYTTILTELQKINDKLEETPHVNFLSLLNSYKRVIDVLDGSISYFYRKRNTLWFKEFFPEEELYKLVKEDLERYHEKYGRINLTITKNGILIYDNYKKNQFNTLLMTVHGGKWVPNYGQELMAISEEKRYQEDDLGADLIYGKLALDNGGVWISAKFSRFFCDLNRKRHRAIYSNTSEKRVQDIWKKELTRFQKERILKNYDQFYYILETLVDTHRFNIIFDGHTMCYEPSRPCFSFGATCIPHFYSPIVEKMRNILHKETGKRIHLNNPYKAGHILNYLSKKYPDIFILSMEINKKLYMDKAHLKLKTREINKLSNAIEKMFIFEKPKSYNKRFSM